MNETMIPITEFVEPQIMRTPRVVDVEVTSRCSLRCKYCYFFDNPEVPYGDRPTEDWLKFFDELGRCNVMNVTLLGGEPFVREDLPELIEGIVRNRMRYSILSNGGLIDDEIAAFLRSTGRCDHVQVSVDGSTCVTHDAGRGRGSFNRAIRGIRALQANDVPIGVRVTIHRKNVHDLEQTAHLLLEELGIPNISFNSAGYLGSAKLNADDMLLNIDERSLAMQTLLRLSAQYDGRILATAGPLWDAKSFLQMEQARAEGAPAFPNGGRLTGCNCPAQKLAVRSDGTMVTCTLLPTTELGKINGEPLDILWERSQALGNFRQRRSIPLSDFEYCKDCSYRPYCTGNCPAMSYTLTGEINRPSPDACMRLFLEEGGKLPDPVPEMELVA